MIWDREDRAVIAVAKIGSCLVNVKALPPGLSHLTHMRRIATDEPNLWHITLGLTCKQDYTNPSEPKRSSKPKVIGCAYRQDRLAAYGEAMSSKAIGYRMVDVNTPSVPVGCASFACSSALVKA